MNPTQECPVCGQPSRKQYVHPDGYIFRCMECTHAFTDPSSPSQETYDEGYFLETHRNWFLHPNTALFRRIQHMLRPEDCRDGLLDVGCGRGDLLFHLEKSNPALSLAGIDIAPLPAHPQIHFVSRDLFDWEPDRPYSIVTSLAVIEHVADIRGFLGKLRRFVKKGGRLVIMTLNEDGVLYAIARGALKLGFHGPFERLYSRHHRHHFTRRSLRSLVEISEFQVLEHYTHNFPLAAVDFPSRGFWMDSSQKAGVAALFGLGRIFRSGFLQTIVCKA